MKTSLYCCIVLALLGSCKNQEKWSNKDQKAPKTAICTDWTGDAKGKSRFDVRCPSQNEAVRMDIPHFLLDNGNRPDATYPYLFNHVTYFSKNTNIYQHNVAMTGLLVFVHRERKDTIAEFAVRDGKIMEAWLRDSLGNTFKETWNMERPKPIDEDRPIQVRKPVLYLYPEQEQVVSVRLRLAGALEHSYPAYPQEGWQVLAQPNGSLKSLQTGREYYALYWEAQDQPSAYTVQQGFVVKGKDTEVFLDQTLEQLGFTRREANEFIMYWLPILEKNAYNLLHFSTEQYAQRNRLEIEPQPQSSLRVMMLYRPLDAPMAIQPQIFSGFERKGFTVVEWGGALWREGM